ncbi:MAG: hypothetical protein H6739_29870 [Alphaproteobacteria bacterium]|nr:hypothetical protein [Alphaproteobacteria bacterium]
MRRRTFITALGVLLMPLPALAGEREEAELERLVEDLQRFSERQVWTGVERRYEQILGLGDVQVPREVHLTAAHAARARGDIAATLDRLERANRVERDDEVDAWILEINEQYGRVTLLTVPPRGIDMRAEVMPFEPDKRKVVELAVRELEEEGVFIGMLPAGRYQMGGREFEVIPGVGTTVELSAKELRAEKKRQRDDDEDVGGGE